MCRGEGAGWGGRWRVEEERQMCEESWTGPRWRRVDCNGRQGGRSAGGELRAGEDAADDIAESGEHGGLGKKSVMFRRRGGGREVAGSLEEGG
eukprot:719802-Rhodomonas_salina.1